MAIGLAEISAGIVIVGAVPTAIAAWFELRSRYKSAKSRRTAVETLQLRADTVKSLYEAVSYRKQVFPDWNPDLSREDELLEAIRDKAHQETLKDLAQPAKEAATKRRIWAFVWGITQAMGSPLMAVACFVVAGFLEPEHHVDYLPQLLQQVVGGTGLILACFSPFWGPLLFLTGWAQVFRALFWPESLEPSEDPED